MRLTDDELFDLEKGYDPNVGRLVARLKEGDIIAGPKAPRLMQPLGWGERRHCPRCNRECDGADNFCGDCGVTLRFRCSSCCQLLPLGVPDQTLDADQKP